MKFSEKASYIEGLMDGLDINASTKEGKVMVKMMELIKDMSMTMESMQGEIEELTELVDLVDSDLSEVEDFLENDYEDEEDECDDDHCDCGCEDDDDFYDDEDLYEVTCPSCGDTICLDEDMLDEGSIRCPNCNENLEFDFTAEDFDDLDDVVVEEDSKK